MLELGNVTNALSGGHTLNPRQSVTSESADLPSPTAASADKADVAVIRDVLDTQEAQQYGSGADTQPSSDQSIAKLVAAIRQKVEEFKELLEGITTGRFSAKSLSADLEAQAAQIQRIEDPANRVYSDVSELLSQFKEAVNQIRSSDEFLIGVHDKIEHFSNQAEFKLGQVDAVGEHIIDVNEDLELGIFTLARVREEALKALRCQEAPESHRVLALLKDEPHEHQAAEQTTPAETVLRGQDVLL